jgi:xanthine dehydrogenase accessory factor
VIERLHSKSGIEETLAALSHHERVVRALDLVTGVATVERAAAQKTLSFDGTVLRSVHGPRWRLLVIGAGPIAEYLVDMSAALDLAITVCDPRPEYQASWRRTDCPLDTAMPDDAVVAFKPDVSSAIVALTHDPKQDDLALMEALQSEAFYVGALGSRAAQEKRRQRLLEFVSAEQLSKLKGPVGLPIGSRSPPELAIAILADLIACKNGIMLQRREEKPSGGMP